MSNGRRRTYSPEISADIEVKLATLTAQLTAAKEKCAELAAALDRLRKNALEMAGYVKPYGLDDAGPQSEWSRYIQCRSNIENGTDPTAILAAVCDLARLEGGVMVEARLRRNVETLTHEEARVSSDVFCRSLSERDEWMKREGGVEILKDLKLLEPTYDPPHNPNQGREDQYARGRSETWAEFEAEFDRRIAALEGKG